MTSAVVGEFIVKQRFSARVGAWSGVLIRAGAPKARIHIET